MRKIAGLGISKAENRLCSWVVSKLHGAEIRTEIGSVPGRVVAVCVVSAAPDVITHVVPLSGVR
jgi:hypothetical protein